MGKDALDGLSIFSIGLICGLLLFGSILMIIGDRGDIVDTYSLGVAMCHEKGLEYSRRVIDNNVGVIIYCTDNTTKIEDGYLRKE